jgi:predicted transcriptional regulator of viral defense system
MKNLTKAILEAVENSPGGITTLDVLESLQLCGRSTLKTVLSRLNRSGRIIRLRRGVYSSNPIRDAFAAAQATFDGYIGFSSALYVHRLITEVPFTITVVTAYESASKIFGSYEFRAVALREKAIGFENIGSLVVSTRAKTLFDCIYLERYSVGEEKLVEAYRTARLSTKEWNEFSSYVKRFATQRTISKFGEIKRKVMRKG